MIEVVRVIMHPLRLKEEYFDDLINFIWRIKFLNTFIRY